MIGSLRNQVDTIRAQQYDRVNFYNKMVGEDNTCKGVRPITEEDCENHHIPSKFGVIMDGKRKNMEDYYERLK
jgi:hypothetical protein